MKKQNMIMGISFILLIFMVIGAWLSSNDNKN